MNYKKNTRAHLLLGIILVLLGIAVLAEIVDAVPWNMRGIIFSWQMVLIILGVVFISGHDSKSTGYILLAIGVFFMLPKFMDLPGYWRNLFWPSILILVGLLVIFGKGRHTNINREFKSGEDVLDDVAVFGGSEKSLYSENFKGGKITNIFGGSKYDLRKVILSEGVNYLDVTMIFGGSKFIVPEDWDIKIEITAVFGGFSDKRQRSIVVPDSSRRLIIRGVTIFGGGEITNI
ncbi:MAG: LiaF domain-containing protein [Bacteroidales bacterium]